MIVGLGTGSTTAFALDLLGQPVAEGLGVIGIPTSKETEQHGRDLGIPLSTLGKHDHIDIAIDGAAMGRRSRQAITRRQYGVRPSSGFADLLEAQSGRIRRRDLAPQGLSTITAFGR